MSGIGTAVAVIGIASGIAKGIGGWKKKRDAKKKEKKAQAALDKATKGLEAVDTSNPFKDAKNAYAGLENMYEGMENRFEDMTVDMRAADFQAQQGQQQRANILQGLRGSAGCSGVAGLAQALANQGQMQTQQIAAGIGQQERQNQMFAMQEGSRIDQMEREGQASVQAAEAGRQSTLLGMDYGALAGANQAYQGSLSNQMSGMGMKADVYGAQSQNNMFSTLVGVGAQVAGGIGAAGGMTAFMI